MFPHQSDVLTLSLIYSIPGSWFLSSSGLTADYKLICYLLEMVSVYHLSALNASPAKKFLIPFLHWKPSKCCSRQRRHAGGTPWQPRYETGGKLQPRHCSEVTKMAVGLHSFQTVLWGAYQLEWSRHVGFSGTHLVYACCPKLIIHRLPIQAQKNSILDKINGRSTK